MKTSKLGFLLSSAMLLAACGQGGSNENSSASNRSIVSASRITSSTSVAPTKTALTGEGTEENPCNVEEAHDFELIAALYDEGEIKPATGLHFSLTKDIDFQGNAPTQIAEDGAGAFNGYFHGNGHTLKNFSLSLSITKFTGTPVIVGGLVG